MEFSSLCETFVNSGFKIQESCQCPLAKSYKPPPGQLQLGGRGQRRMAISGAWKNQNHGNNSEEEVHCVWEEKEWK